MKTMYWQVVGRGVGYYTVEIWAKDDKSDKITEKFVILDKDRILYRIEQITGKRYVELVQVKKG